MRPADGPWVDAWLSQGRWSRYLTQTGGDRVLALELYEWNTQLSAALQRDLAHLEIALRNGYDTAASTYWSGPGHWLRDDAPQVFSPVLRSKRARSGARYQVDVNKRPREIVNQAVRDAGGPTAPTGKVVAQLSFGFWRYLSSSAHEKTLWVPLLHHAFPPATNRPNIDGQVGRLHSLRNRVAHHEALLNEDLPARFGDLIAVAMQLNTELGHYLQATSVVDSLLSQRPG